MMDPAGSNAAPWLWNELHDFFDTDDGSLPEIRVDYVDTGATVTGYALLRKRAPRLVSEGASFWSEAHSEERLVDSVPNAAALVVSGDVESFHVVLGGIESGGVTIPDLGVFVCADQIALDYRMGTAWGPREVNALFELLRELVALDSDASLSLEEWVDADYVARFQSAWRRWAAE